jgi:competence transcription factor ComK
MLCCHLDGNAQVLLIRLKCKYSGNEELGRDFRVNLLISIAHKPILNIAYHDSLIYTTLLK